MRVAGFFTALAFLSIIPQPGTCTNQSLGQAMPWFGLAGLFIGLFSLLAGLLIWFLLGVSVQECGAPLFAVALFSGLAWLGAEIWLTRALHWDGLADVGDALGSNSSGEKFHLVLKDSRLGAFGAILLLFMVLLQWLASSVHFQAVFTANGDSLCLGRMLPLALACVWSRLLPLWVARPGKAYASKGLGAEICAYATSRLRLLAWILAAGVMYLLCWIGLPLWQLALLAIVQCFFNSALLRIADNKGGLSGDFFGAGIESSQGLFLFLTI